MECVPVVCLKRAAWGLGNSHYFANIPLLTHSAAWFCSDLGEVRMPSIHQQSPIWLWAFQGKQDCPAVSAWVDPQLSSTGLVYLQPTVDSWDWLLIIYDENNDDDDDMHSRHELCLTHDSSKPTIRICIFETREKTEHGFDTVWASYLMILRNSYQLKCHLFKA